MLYLKTGKQILNVKQDPRHKMGKGWVVYKQPKSGKAQESKKPKPETRSNSKITTLGIQGLVTSGISYLGQQDYFECI